MFGRADLWLSLLALVGVTVAATRAMLRSPARPEGDRRTAWLLGAGAFAVVCGASLAEVDRWAFSHPFWDQWWEARKLYDPFVHARYHWSELFAPHNEHRIALTRLWALMVLMLRGFWDNRSVDVANALLHGFSMGLLAFAVALRERFRDAFPTILVLVIPASLALAFDNVLHGFQSQFYFLLIYAVLALWLMTFSEPRRGGFWLGALCALIAVFTVGSGLMASVALLLTALLECVRDRSVLRERVPLIAVALVVAIIGWLCRVQVEYLMAAHATNLKQLLTLALQCWSFPFVDSLWPAPFLWAPWLVWTLSLVRERRRWTPDERFFVALGGFVFVHGLLIGWARANDTPRPANRYFDILALGLFVNAWAFTILLRLRTTLLVRSLFAAWLVLAAVGTTMLGRHTFADELPYHDIIWTRQQNNLREYLAKGNPEVLRKPAWEIPHWSADDLRGLLDDPYIRGIMPYSVRPEAAPANIWSGRIGPIKYIVVGAGLLLWLAAWMRRRRV